jgi:hypothetical protein
MVGVSVVVGGREGEEAVVVGWIEVVVIGGGIVVGAAIKNLRFAKLKHSIKTAWNRSHNIIFINVCTYHRLCGNRRNSLGRSHRLVHRSSWPDSQHSSHPYSSL